MWEIRVKHEGLNAYRVVRGSTKEEAEQKAQLQIAAWNERWLNKLEALKAKKGRLQRSSDVEANKRAARIRTTELEEQIAEVQSILAVSIRREPLRWVDLKDITPFAPRCPAEPAACPDPVKPDYPKPPDSLAFNPELTFLDRLLSGRRAKKENEASARLKAATIAWECECAAIDDAHKKKVSANEALNASQLRKFRDIQARWESDRKQYIANQERQHAQIDALREEYTARKSSAVEYFFSDVLNHSAYPESFPQGNTLAFNESSGVLIVDFELPNQSALPAIKEVRYVMAREQFQEVPVSEAWLKKTYDEVLYQIALRTMWELYIADESEVLKSIVFNGWVQSIDKATGVETHGCILSVQASREEFLQINLAQVEPKACFRKLKGVASSKLVELTPIRPILTISREDHRFVEGYAVADSLDDRTNLASMDWLDFENLIRELFEKVFSKNGGEVKITQASRDGGVDAVAFDPDPIRGGKIIIQAKRYTNVVGVSAVRDLFGTVHNEGAIKGILVTTSTYGPDAYEFAKDKPLTLLSGGELLSLLADHGHRAKIDLQEAKALYLSKQN